MQFTNIAIKKIENKRILFAIGFSEINEIDMRLLV